LIFNKFAPHCGANCRWPHDAHFAQILDEAGIVLRFGKAAVCCAAETGRHPIDDVCAPLEAAWIRTCRYVVDYVPFIGQPVPTESKSWGDVKALFR
jgi:hypothetical protein